VRICALNLFCLIYLLPEGRSELITSPDKQLSEYLESIDESVQIRREISPRLNSALTVAFAVVII